MGKADVELLLRLWLLSMLELKVDDFGLRSFGVDGIGSDDEASAVSFVKASNNRDGAQLASSMDADLPFGLVPSTRES